MDSRMQGKGLTITLLVLALAAFTLATSARGQTTSSQRASATNRNASNAGGARTLGLFLGVHSIAATGITLSGEEFDAPYELKGGAGAGVTIGYGFNRSISSYVSLDVAKLKTAPNEAIEGSYGLGHLEIGVRANMPLGNPNVTPYVLGSFGRRGLGATATDYESGESAKVAFSGQMYGLGAGIEYFFSRSMSLDGGVHLSFGKFDHLTQDGEDYDLTLNGTTSTRLRLGVTWRP